jgi:hypothetical protein
MKGSSSAMKTLTRLVMALAIAACAGSMSNAELMTWDVETDFSSTTNPNGAWSYGVYLEDAYELTDPPTPPYVTWGTPMLEHPAIPNWWYYGNPGPDLNAGAICANPTANYANYTPCNLWMAPGDVGLFAAGYGWAYAPVIRWTAPSDMTVSIDALFYGQSDTVSSDVHIVKNGDIHDGSDVTGWRPAILGTELLSGEISGNLGCPPLGISPTGTNQSLSYSGTVNMLAGEYIDFWNSFGSNLNYAPDDQVGLEARITEVPEPGTLVVLATGLICLIGLWRRK